MAKVYTKTGDKGQTSLFTGERVDKDCLRVEVYGIVDEIEANLGFVRAIVESEELRNEIYGLQRMLWLLMADLASLNQEAHIKEEQVVELENIIDKYDARLQPLSKFLVSGDTKGSAALHIARTITRRAERALWKLSKTEEVHESNIRFLNRLSDLCFILARAESEL